MTKLLRANFSRLWRSKAFWACLILTLAASVFIRLWAFKNDNWQSRTAYLFMNGNVSPAVALGIFAPLFLGAEYSYKTMRNKLIIGSSRVNIYFANLLTVISAGLIMTAANWLPCAFFVGVGNALGMPSEQLAFRMLIIVCAVVAFAAIFTLLGMLIPSRLASVAISIFVGFRIITTGMVIINALNIPEFIEDSETSNAEPERSDNYIGGANRNILIAINDILPGGQLAQIEADQLHNEKALPLYSLGVIAVSTAAGVMVFRKKDLK